jgi:uncharacterized protein YjbI with pentapeptide repeats
MNLSPERQAQYDAYQVGLSAQQQGRRLNWNKADLSAADLRGANLSGSDVRYAFYARQINNSQAI